MLGADRRDMGGVVLEAQDGRAKIFGETGREIIRVQVAGDGLRPHVEQAQQMRRALFVEPKRFGVGEVADVLAHESFAAARQSEGGLQMAAAGEHAGAVFAEVDGLGHKTARAAQEGGGAIDDLHDAVVGAHDNVAVVRDDQVGDVLRVFEAPRRCR